MFSLLFDYLTVLIFCFTKVVTFEFDRTVVTKVNLEKTL